MNYQFIVTVYNQHPLTGNPRAYSKVFDESVEMQRIITWARNVTQVGIISISDLVFSEFTDT